MRISTRSMEELDDDLWLLESRVKSLRLAVIFMGFILEAAIILSIVAITVSTDCPLW